MRRLLPALSEEVWAVTVYTHWYVCIYVRAHIRMCMYVRVITCPCFPAPSAERAKEQIPPEQRAHLEPRFRSLKGTGPSERGPTHSWGARHPWNTSWCWRGSPSSGNQRGHVAGHGADGQGPTGQSGTVCVPKSQRMVTRHRRLERGPPASVPVTDVWAGTERLPLTVRAPGAGWSSGQRGHETGSALAASGVRRPGRKLLGEELRGLSTGAPVGVRRGPAERGRPSGHLVGRSGEQREARGALGRDWSHRGTFGAPGRQQQLKSWAAHPSRNPAYKH